MSPSIHNRVHRARTSELLTTDWDADTVGSFSGKVTHRRPRIVLSDRVLLSLDDDPQAAEATLRPLVRAARRDVGGVVHAKLIASLLRRRARLAARAVVHVAQAEVR